MKRTIKAKNIIKHVQPLCDLTKTSEVIWEQVREHKLAFNDAIEELTTFKAPEEEKKYMLDDTDYESYESLNKKVFAKKSRSNKAKRLKEPSSDPVKSKTEVRAGSKRLTYI